MDKVFVNLTPHPLIILDRDGKSVSIPATGDVARVSSTDTVVGHINGITIHKVVFGDVVGVPDPRPDTVFLVSRMVKDRISDRDDVMVPGLAVRDSDGRVIGSNGISL